MLSRVLRVQRFQWRAHSAPCLQPATSDCSALLPCHATSAAALHFRLLCCGFAVPAHPAAPATASFVLALEGLWLFGQPPATYLQQASSTAPPAPTATTATAAAAAVEAGQQQLQRLWPSFLLRLLARLEAAVGPTAAQPAAAASTDSTTPSPKPAPAARGESAESIQAGVIAPAAPLLFGMLGEALQHLALAWQQHPTAARAALIRATLADSQQPLVVQQRRSAALLGKGKPKAGEAVCGQLLVMTRQLALLLTELLQLERSTCGGPQRDGTVPVAESGSWLRRVLGGMMMIGQQAGAAPVARAQSTIWTVGLL